MNKTKNYLIIGWLIIAVIGLFFTYQKAQATSPTFTLTYADMPAPLFSEIKMAPMDTVTKQIQVTNNGDQTERFALNLHNLISVPDPKLAEVLTVEVSHNSTIFVPSTHLSDLADDEIVIQDIPAGQTFNYDIKVTMDNVGNEYQSKQTSFDLTFGWQKAGFKGILGEAIGPVGYGNPATSSVLPQTGANATLSIFSFIVFLGIIAVINIFFLKLKKN